MTKWWKCDLQVATPAWKFKMPATPNYELSAENDQVAFADRYMEKLVSKGIEVISLADHNTGDWIDTMVAAGRRRHVAVFPGCEITTGSGADGIHLILIGNLNRTSHDFDLLLAGSVGFDHDHPRYHVQGDDQKPGSSGKTMLQVLDGLPDDYLVIAPHCLNNNGIASSDTVKGDIRWRALHHPRLSAVDPGDCSSANGTSWNDRFRRRELDNFPCLKDLPFVSTSDAYQLDELGRRFCWIRMEEPSIEALRQAFLDREARVLCDWDPRLTNFPDRDPNQIRHPWIEEVSLNGSLGNSTANLIVSFHPALNVIIGGRGSGKSTVVAAIRNLYSGFATLPQPVRDEAERFSEAIFTHASLSAIHRLPQSQERQQARWGKAAGSSTQPENGPAAPTGFRVRVVNQKELFARVSYDPKDPLSASRSFIAFVDESLDLIRRQPIQAGTWWRRFEDASTDYIAAVRDQHKLETDVAQLPAIRARIREMEGQVAAFDSPEAKSRREGNDARTQQRRDLTEREESLIGLLERLKQLASDPIRANERDLAWPHEFTDLASALDLIEGRVRDDIRRAVAEGERGLKDWRQIVVASDWSNSVVQAAADADQYVMELQLKGVSPEGYNKLRVQLAEQKDLEKSLVALESQLDDATRKRDQAWSVMLELLEERRTLRVTLLQEVSQKSQRLRFELRGNRDSIGWVNSIRQLLNLRADAFLDDVPNLAVWLWGALDEPTRKIRWGLWRSALATGDFTSLGDGEGVDLRPQWQKRLEALDETLRLRLSTEIADDIVEMAFLKDGGEPQQASDWQNITEGSPGQRTAAMLAFVLHHGSEPLVLDQPEDDLDTEWISSLVVSELRASRWKRQIIVVTHNANIPVNGDAERVLVLENKLGALQVRESVVSTATGDQKVPHCGAIELAKVREDIQNIMEGGIHAFVQRERKYNNEIKLTTTTVI